MEHNRFYRNNKHRSNRLLKKLHLGPYQIMGFSIKCTLVTPLELDAYLDIMDALQDQLSEHESVFACNLEDGHVSGKVYDCTEAVREKAIAWLTAQPAITAVDCSELYDAWNS